MKLPNDDLVSRLKEGNENAFRELVLNFQNRIYNISLNIVQQAEDAEDITQEVFVEVFYSVKNFKGESSLSTWLHRITVNRSLDLLRRRKRKKRFAFIERLFADDDLKPLRDVEHFVHPGVLLEQKENAKILFSAIRNLPDNQQAAFTLHKMEGMSYKEVSDAMKISVPSVESLIHRAKENLKKNLSDYYEQTFKN